MTHLKSIALALLFLSGFHCLAIDDTNVIAITDWSQPVDCNDHALRGRLMVLEGVEPAYGGPKTERRASLFVELQHVTGACCPSVKLYFDVMGLNCELVDSKGKPVPLEPVHGWGGGGPLDPRWVILPYNSSIRLFINAGSRVPLQICQNGEPWRRWSIDPNPSKPYFLSGTLNIAIPTNSVLTVTPPVSVGPHDYAEWEGKLVFPKTRLVVKKK